MPIVKRRLDICGREKRWQYVIESGGERYDVAVRQVGSGEPEYTCSCGSRDEEEEDSPTPSLFQGMFHLPCRHVAEVQRDLSIARQAATQMIP